ncbi:MAG TPA: GNAT family protein [Acidimicrobiales bacterium]|nr:GNAT family protein [Acidimicrobiales bacterium]
MIRTGPPPLELAGRRVRLRPLALHDFEAYRDVRRRCRDWLVKWEPRGAPGQPDAAEDRRAFAALCGARDRERQLGTGYGFGVFVDPDDGGAHRFGGVINISSIQRGPFQNAYVGYWMDEALAGHSYTPEATVVLFRYAFEELALHRLQVAIIPRNTASRRVAEKLGLREEGIAERYLQINGVWEDHVRYAITAEEWAERCEDYARAWLTR